MDSLFEEEDTGPIDYMETEVQEDEEITQEDAWVVIDQYFHERGLVGQQIDSFDEFIRYTIQELVNDAGEITVTPEDQFIHGQDVEPYTYIVKFGEIYVTPPAVFEDDGHIRECYPQEARLRSLTYASPVYMDIETKQYQLDENRKYKPDDEPVKKKEFSREFLGYIPVMLRSNSCSLKNRTDRDLTKVGECVFDQGGYFIINGSEKVMIAQERMSNNHVYVFKKQQPSKFEWVCETRSHITTGSRPTSTMYLQMYGAGSRGSIDGHQLRSTLPYIRTDIPVVVVFRALGFISDKDIIGHIVYDFQDKEMMERFRPSLEEAMPVKHQNVALDYIGKRGSAINVGRKERIQYAREILQKEVLPHVGTEENNETKKAFFMGYIVHKMLMCSLGRLEEDDRDHFGKKRLDLAGPLMGGLFRMLFKKLTKEVKKHLQKSLDEGRDFNIILAMKTKVMTDGMKYCLATGNWGDRKNPSKAGVVQVLNRLTYASALSHLRRCNAPLAKGKLQILLCVHIYIYIYVSMFFYTYEGKLTYIFVS
jgi:DNA-directed RNA polymerase II subunit RPB2